MTTPLWPAAYPQPEQDGYRVTRGRDNVSIRLDGGPARVRRDSLGTPHEVELRFVCDETDYTSVIGFLRERTESRTRFFRIPLLIDAPVVVPYLARVLDGPEVLESTRGLTHVVRCTLEVIPNPIKSFSLLLQNVADERVVDAGTVDYDGDMGEFPVGRDVMLVGCTGTSNGVALDLDGTYTIDSKPNAFSLILDNAAAENSDWTALNGTASQQLFPTNQHGACILLPE